MDRYRRAIPPRLHYCNPGSMEKVTSSHRMSHPSPAHLDREVDSPGGSRGRARRTEREPMHNRTFGRTGWSVSEVGYGMWGMGSWSGSNDDESMASLERAVDRGCNFFDTAWAYGQGHSERLLGQLLRARPSTRLYSASKVPPKNMKWPATPEMSLDDTFPPDHIRAFAEKSLENIGVSTLDLLQFHTWSDAW